MAEKTWHYRVGSGWAKCGAHVSRPTSVLALTRDQSKVTCRNCIRGKGVQPMMNPLLYDDPRSATKAELRLHIVGLEAKIESLTESYGNADAEAKRWREHAEHIQSLAAEGKDPLSGEEPEFWMVVVIGDGEEPPRDRYLSREIAVSRAEEGAKELVGNRVYILPAFEYCISEVLPVAWPRRGKPRKADEEEMLF